MNRFRHFVRKVFYNNTKTTWVLKCDIRKFFANIDCSILKGILKRHIIDVDVLWLLDQIIDSFYTKDFMNVGLPLGNITSQLFINVYMNELDQFMKRELKVQFYVRYADDCIILSRNKAYLFNLIPQISEYLESELKLSLHQDKGSGSMKNY